ncbi:MAG TPA: ferric reductase-like transmembrane domain-containing protein, partial [bacterium]|nr:ferric reductase-like transmembrane domain-containing protein [bacterium]
MGLKYQAVLWNPQKKRYDAAVAAGVVLYLAAFVGVGAFTHPDATAETLLIRGLGTAALVLLHVILSIGPLARLDSRFLPFLYNRRHLGVTMFLLAAAHAGFAVVQFHSLGDVNPLVSVLTSNPRVDSVSQFPFELLGLAALAILFLMAATSHDFWLANLTAPAWKSLHMMVYVAWGLLVLHVALGTLQAERQPLPAVLLGGGALWVLGLHLTAAFRERVR